MLSFCFRPSVSVHALLLAGAAAGILVTAPRARAATIHVTVTTPDAASDGQCSLFEAIQAAESNSGVDSCEAGSGVTDTIDIPAGTYEILVPAASGFGLPPITTRVVLHGAGSASTTIRRAANAPVFTLVKVSSASTLEGLTLSGGASSGGSGSTILGEPAVALTLNDVVVRGSRGGAAWWPAVGVVTNSKFLDNDGAIETRFDNQSPLSIDGSTFEDNVSSSRSPLGLVGPVTITNSIFRGNGVTGGGEGGAIHSLGVTTVRSCVFEENDASQGSGGAIWSSGTLDVSGSAFVRNAAGYGGAVYLDEGRIVNSTFSGNTAVSRGGAVDVIGDANVTLNNVTITRNVSQQLGGGLAMSGTAALVVSNSVVANNQGSTGIDCYTANSATITSGGYNFLGRNTGCPGYAAGTDDQVGSNVALDPRLSTLDLRGGTTPAHAPLMGSPLVDRGNPGSGRVCETTDQIGTTRPVGPRCDIGAFEGSVGDMGGSGGMGGAAGGGGKGGVSGSSGEGGAAGDSDDGGEAGDTGTGGSGEAGADNGGSGARGGTAGSGGRGGTGSGRGGTSSAGEGGEGASSSGGPGGGGSGDSGGCGCRVAGSAGRSTSAGALFVLALGLVTRRRRKRAAATIRR